MLCTTPSGESQNVIASPCVRRMSTERIAPQGRILTQSRTDHSAASPKLCCLTCFPTRRRADTRIVQTRAIVSPLGRSLPSRQSGEWTSTSSLVNRRNHRRSDERCLNNGDLDWRIYLASRASQNTSRAAIPESESGWSLRGHSCQRRPARDRYAAPCSAD